MPKGVNQIKKFTKIDDVHNFGVLLNFFKVIFFKIFKMIDEVHITDVLKILFETKKFTNIFIDVYFRCVTNYLIELFQTIDKVHIFGMLQIL